MSFLASLLNVFLWCVIFGLIVQCCCRVKRRHERLQNQATTQTRATTTEQPPATANGENNVENNAADPALRSKVLQAIFPEQTIENNVTLVYDPESNGYQWTNENMGDVLCSICLENFEPGDVITSSHCSHTYHRDCILGWLQVKDECPNCRQQMWEPEAYQMLEEEVRAMELRASTK